MTTIDTWISNAAGTNKIEFHNGLGGPATYVMHRTIEAVEGEGSSLSVGQAGVDVSIGGLLLRTMMKELVTSGGYRDSATAAELELFTSKIEDDEEYYVRAVEF